MEKRLVAIHVPSRKSPAPAGEHIDVGLKNWGRPELALALRELDMSVVFSRGPEAFDFENNMANVLVPSIKKVDGDYEVTVIPSVISIATIDAIRNVNQILGHNSPELNHPLLRASTRNKAISNDILKSVGHTKQYSVVSNQNLEASLELITSDIVAFKPLAGSRSEGVVIATKAEIVQLVREGKIDLSKKWMVEEYLDNSPAMPIRGIDEQEQEKIDFANKNAIPKELRVYCFGRNDAGRLIHSYVLRIAPENHNNTLSNDKWVYIDPTSVPEEVLSQSDAIVKAFELNAGVKEIHIAIDWAYALRNGSTTADWKPMEVNGGEPQLVYEKNNPAVAVEHAAKLADQLYRVAHQTERLAETVLTQILK